MDYSVLAFVLSVWFYRATLFGVSKLLDGQYCLEYSRVTIMAALTRAAEALKPFNDQILQHLLNAPCVYIDETSLLVGKMRMYVWVITDKTYSYYFVHTRAVDMLLELFGSYKGIVESDGYHTCKLFDNIQRCWAHVLRKCKWFANNEEALPSNRHTARRFRDRMHDIFRFAVDEKLAGRGAESYQKAARMLRGTLAYYGRFPEIADLITHVKNAEPDMFTFMLHKDVEPTNNAAERSLREIVKQRVVRVMFRTKKGADAFAALITALMTARARGISIDNLVTKYM